MIIRMNMICLNEANSFLDKIDEKSSIVIKTNSQWHLGEVWYESYHEMAFLVWKNANR